jgi:hypothetical protein
LVTIPEQGIIYVMYGSQGFTRRLAAINILDRNVNSYSFITKYLLGKKNKDGKGKKSSS